MARVPTHVLSDHVRDAIGGRRILAGVFTTFTLEPAFFEEEVLALLADDSLVQQPRARLYQLEQSLRGAIGPLAVYYDQRGLRANSSKVLDVRYVPVSVKTGLFHPKVILLLTAPRSEEDGQAYQLICGVLSANLTQSGWWSSLECAHFETIREGDACPFGRDLRDFLRTVRSLGGREPDHEPLDKIYTWLGKATELPSRGAHTAKGPWLIAGNDSVGERLAAIRGTDLRGTSLEIVAPFLDRDRTSAIEGIRDGLHVREVCIFLPTKTDGSANITRDQYDAVRALDHCQWGRLPQELLRIGKDANAVDRGVHAKVFRFTHRTRRYEAVLVGSHNLTGAALGRGGNVEASFFVERTEPGAPERWLSPVERGPSQFATEIDPGDEASDAFIPLQLAYDWQSGRTEALWGGSAASPRLSIEASSPLFDLVGLPPEEWVALDDVKSAELGRILVSTALLQVRDEVGRVASFLVQEYNMARKPSVLSTWTVADVLEYWARLTSEQKAAFLADLAGNVPEDVSNTLERATRLPHAEGFFTTFAGIFHGFEMLRRQVLDSLNDGQPRQAEYLLLGNRHDSLPSLIERLKNPEAADDALQAYLLLLSARGLLSELKRRPEPFFAEHSHEITRLIGETRHSDLLATKLNLGDDGPKFLGWFERHFVKPTRSGAGSDD